MIPAPVLVVNEYGRFTYVKYMVDTHSPILYNSIVRIYNELYKGRVKEMEETTQDRIVLLVAKKVAQTGLSIEEAMKQVIWYDLKKEHDLLMDEGSKERGLITQIVTKRSGWA